jgi:hypothetical protein
MSILVVGSVAFDSIKSAFGVREKILGGSATYFALAASYFTQVRVVGVVGDDFTAREEHVLGRRGIDTRGIQRAQGKTFHWSGEYGENLNEAKTKFTHLNVFETFQPQIPPEYRDTEFLFLANIDPVLQADVRRLMSGARLVGGDTMNFWINGKREELDETLKLIEGAFGIGHHPFRAPALPLDEVRDPTGAGDSFAGGFMGYIASQGTLNREVLKRAMFYGGVMGSFAVECFGTERLQNLTREEIDSRFQMFRELTHLE